MTARIQSSTAASRFSRGELMVAAGGGGNPRRRIFFRRDAPADDRFRRGQANPRAPRHGPLRKWSDPGYARTGTALYDGRSAESSEGDLLRGHAFRNVAAAARPRE